jgi:DNA-binding CsgD family transcriptional regulator
MHLKSNALAAETQTSIGGSPLERASVGSPSTPGWSLRLSDEVWTVIAARLTLSGRETQVVRCVLDNLDTPEIAGRFGISPRTVRAHLEHVYRKLNLGNRCDLVLLVFAVSLE